ncbi:cytochrome c [Pendulispora rubella]|uniref:Cytochrome c n=1 Tax=Pendulispora rubella TaxID=2741070 RepID=A0ABZ2KS49_9BACT
MAFRTIAGSLGGALLVASLVVAAACSSNDASPGGKSDAISDGALPESCKDLTAPTACPSPAPTFASVEPIFEQRCTSCHGGVAGLWPLRGYEHIVDWADTIRGEVLGCSMPPLDAGSGITKEERLAILQWIRCGTPQ